MGFNPFPENTGLLNTRASVSRVPVLYMSEAVLLLIEFTKSTRDFCTKIVLVKRANRVFNSYKTIKFAKINKNLLSYKLCVL